MAFLTRSLAIVTLLIAAVAAGSVPADANHSWGPYHWARTSTPFTLQLGDNMTTAEWKGFLGNVSTDWTAATALDTAITAGGGKRCRTTLGRVEVCNAKFGFNGWLGLAQIWINSENHIVQGAAKVNDTYFSTATYNDPSAKRHVLCQEVGHTFGLGHQAAVSCMDDKNGLFDPTYVSPNQHDYDQLDIIYAHTDGSSTVKSGAVAAPGNAGGEGRDGNGTPHGASPSRGSVYVTDLGGGARLITFVFWVSPGR